MTESDITVLDMTSGEEVRTITRDIGGTTKHMQIVTPYCGVIGSWLTYYAQKYSAHLPTDNPIYGTTFTLPGNLTAKWFGGAASAQTTQLYILRRRPLPNTLYSPGTNSVEKTIFTTQSTTDNTVVVNALRFFLIEPLLDALTISKMVQFKAMVGVYTENASATAHLQGVTFSLLKLTGNDTYTSITSASIPINIINQTTTEIQYSFIADAPVTTPVTVYPGEVLVLEISTEGKSTDASYKAYHSIFHTRGTSQTFIELLVEDI